MRKGLLYNLISNVIFFASGYALHFFLGSSMSPAEYGIVGSIITVLDFEYMFLSNGARQSAAREISSKRYDIKDLILKTFAFQAILIGFFFCVNFFGAPVFGHALNDDSLTFYFRVAAFLVPANGIYVMLLGINDGLQRFGTSALLGGIYPIAKLSAIPLIIFVFRDNPVLGVEIGFLLALLSTTGVGAVLLLTQRRPQIDQNHVTETIPFRVVAKHTLSFSFFFIIVSLVLSVDTLIVKATIAPASYAGFYTGAVNFGKLSYSLMSAFATIILPVVSQRIGEKDMSGALSKIQENLLLAVAFILPITLAISATSAPLLSAFYKPEYAAAAPALSMLSLSNFFMGLIVLFNMVLSAYENTHFSDALSIISLIIVVPAFIIAAKTGGITALAATSMVCTFTGAAVSYWRILTKIGQVILPKTVYAFALNIVYCLVNVIIARLIPANLIVLALVYVISYAGYVAMLLLCKIIHIPHFSNR